MLPLYAEALDLPPDYFAPAFKEPLYRMRLSPYPKTPPGNFGINPHVDTSFFTLLVTSGPGLVVHSLARNTWVRVKYVAGGKGLGQRFAVAAWVGVLDGLELGSRRLWGVGHVGCCCCVWGVGCIHVD